VLTEEKLKEIGARCENFLKEFLRRDTLHSGQGFMVQACTISEELQYIILGRHEYVLNNKEHSQHPLRG
jgi:hypothetical protein